MMSRTLCRNPALLLVTGINILLFTYIFNSVSQQNLRHIPQKQRNSFEFEMDPPKDTTTKHRENSVHQDVVINVDTADKPKTSHNSDDGPTPVILLTYMRSGSSFVGDMLKAAPGTFYTYEPVHNLQFTIRSNKALRYLDGTLRKYSKFLDAAVKAVRDLATCKSENLPTAVFEDGFFPYGTKYSVFSTCNGGRFINDLEKARTCAKRYSSSCSTSKFFVAKIIRMPLYSLEPLMEELPNLKIIHLFRDPRPTVYSQLRSSVVKRQFIESNVTRYCNRVYDDVVKADDIKRKFPNRYMSVQYEDIVQNPVMQAQKMYKFTGMDYTASVNQAISRLTGPTDKRGSSKETASQWRKKMEMNLVNAVDNSCRQLYKKLGYKIVDENILRSISMPLKGPAPEFDDFRYA